MTLHLHHLHGRVGRRKSKWQSKTFFAEQIRRQSVTVAEVLKLEHTHPLLKNCENKRLHDKVRRLYPFKKTTDGECLEDTQKSG